MNEQEMKDMYYDLYEYMANSKNPANMKLFGKVMTEMFMWYADNEPEAAMEWLNKLSAVKWKNYLTPKEAEYIVSNMEPKAPWSCEQWKQAMESHGLDMEVEPNYNAPALYTTMNMVMSDSSETLKKYVSEENLFDAVYELAVDKLEDGDGKFSIRRYFLL